MAEPSEEVAAAEEAAAAPPRPALPPIDVAGRLALGVASIDEPAITLGQLARFTTDFSGVPVSFDPAALELRGASPADAVPVRLTEATLARILEEGASRRGLIVVPGEHGALVTCPASAAQYATVRYDVSDLAGLEEGDMARFAGVLQELIAPETWEAAGGPGTIVADQRTLTVRQSELVHYQILVLCEKLRVARGLPRRSRYAAELFRLEPRLVRARSLLASAVTANYRPAAPLQKILRYLEDQVGRTILVDWERLAEVGIGPETEAAIAVVKTPLETALDELLAPLGLAWRPLADGGVQISSRQALADHLELEFYPVKGLLVGGLTEQALLEQIKSRVATESWSDAGGSGLIRFDAPSEHAVVLQSPPVQQAIQRYLSELEKRAPAEPH